MPHIQHLYEDRELLLGDIADIALAACSNHLPGASEKLDGVNIVFTCTPRYEARFARSDSDIKAGGCVRQVLEAKYTGRGLVQETFSKGAEVIASSLRHLSPLDVRAAFDDGRLWYSAEIVYTKNPNVVRYAEDGVVFHDRPVLRFDGADVRVEHEAPFNRLGADFYSMDEAAKSRGWRVYGPQRVVMNDARDTPELRDLLDCVERLSMFGPCVGDYLVGAARSDLKDFGVHGPLLDDAVARLVEAPGCRSLAVLKQKLPNRASSLLRQSDDWAKNRLSRLDRCLTAFTSRLLDGVRSGLVDDHDVELARIRSKLDESCRLIRESRNPAAVEHMEWQLSRLSGRTDLVGVVEGVVFPWRGRVYKMTGAFAPANAIMGLMKYGRGKAIPPIGG